MPKENAEMAGLAGKEGWAPLTTREVIGESVSFVSGPPDDQRLRVRYFQRLADNALVARAWFGPGAQGPPGHAHGGSMAAVLDEAMGMAAWLAGHQVVAARINVDFRRLLPLETVTCVETRITAVDGRKVRVTGRIVDDAGHPYAEGEGLFVRISPEQFAELPPTGFG